jgi:sarcosine oxidase gamma subunit
MQTHSTELEQRLAQATAELSTSRALEGRLQQRLAASVPAAEKEELASRLLIAEAAAAKENAAATAVVLRAEEAEKKLADLTHKKQRVLADVTNLRSDSMNLSTIVRDEWHVLDKGQEFGI